ncbi:hypothetical protein ACTFIV_008389 [Dictyostelium citrinum]
MFKYNGYILKDVREKLGIFHCKINANYYKLLIYDEDGFFLPNQDTEKEHHMFGSLCLSLPRKHTCGSFNSQIRQRKGIGQLRWIIIILNTTKHSNGIPLDHSYR